MARQPCKHLQRSHTFSLTDQALMLCSTATDQPVNNSFTTTSLYALPSYSACSRTCLQCTLHVTWASDAHPQGLGCDTKVLQLLITQPWIARMNFCSCHALAGRHAQTTLVFDITFVPCLLPSLSLLSGLKNLAFIQLHICRHAC